MKELIDRLQADETGRVIDAQLWNLVDDRPLEEAGSEDVPCYKRCPEDSVAFDVPPAYTTSLNETIALIQQLLPQWKIGMRQHEGVERTDWHAWLLSPDYRVVHWTAGDKTTSDVVSGQRTSDDANKPEIALLLAMLKALEWIGSRT